MASIIEKRDKATFIDHKLDPRLDTGIFGYIEFFRAAGVTGWVVNFSKPETPILVQAKLDGIVVGSGNTVIERADVAGIAQLEGKFGFQIAWHWSRLASAIKNYRDDEQPPIDIVTQLDPRPILSPPRPTAAEIRKWLKSEGFFALSLQPFSVPWLRAIADLPTPKETSASPRIAGFVEAAMFSQTGETTTVIGWLVGQAETIFWLEDSKGTLHPLDFSHQFFRQDVYDSIAKNMGGNFSGCGFIAVIETPINQGTLKLRALSEGGCYTLCEMTPDNLSSDPLTAARWLFSLQSPLSDFSQRVQTIDTLILSPLIKAHTDGFADLPVKTIQLGFATERPLVSIVIPLFGRIDFVEHQLIEFTLDHWLLQHAEILYVLDDRSLVEDFVSHAQYLHRLYKVPFKWIWGDANRGFSGANNLGVQHAKGSYLLFMNSDVFPKQSGWLLPLVENLANDADLGAVGPRLVFADGSIQHAGMVFMRREELGIWINHHPNMGLDPSLDPIKEITRVPAITGACLLIRRHDFERIEGWDSGYLIGDFEDSDLCLKLRAAGLGVAYNPNVQLVHLERQSFKLLDQDAFRHRVTLYNAARHQTRWKHMITSSGEAG